jgi:inorganic pyrophosphatase
MKPFRISLLCIFIFLITGCADKSGSEEANSNSDVSAKVPEARHLVHDYPAVTKDGLVNVVVEISTGTIEKWEVEKESGELDLEIRNGSVRKVAYLGYPGNYGMVPRTLAPFEQGGDGDPLDVIILGPPIERGMVVPCKIIGMLELLDRGEQDDKLIAVSPNTVFYELDGMEALDAKFGGVSDIIRTWFENYKGSGLIEVIAYRDKEIAEEILNLAIRAYQEETTDVIEE